QRWIIAARELFAPQTIHLHPIYYGRISWRAVLALWGAPWGVTLETSAVLMFLLSGLTMVATAAAATRLAGRAAGLLAALVYATHPLAVLTDVLPLPDGLGVALVTVALVLFLRYLRHGRPASLLLAAVLVGVTVSVKEYFILLAIPFALALLR